MPNILLIPIDNRPVCYQLPKSLTAIDDSIKLFAPPKSTLGDLNNCANYEKILSWAQKTIQKQNIDYAILALDTIAYGGLIPSRRIVSTEDEIKSKIENFINIFKSKQTKIYATSSIMRISNNNINEEEKEYWKDFGRNIFEYSYNLHKQAKEPKHSIPKEVLQDYLETRKRNFNINLFYIELLQQKLIQELILSKDDSAEFGLNVQEAQKLNILIKEKNLNAKVKTGADEIPLTLLSKALIDFHKENIKINPIFLNPKGKNIISRYEDITIESSTKSQIELCGAKVSTDADIDLIVNTPCETQDDIALEIFKDQNFKISLPEPNKPFAIADIKLANGADNKLIKKLLNKKFNDDFLGFAGWNTSANTLGTTITMSMIAFIAKKHNNFNSDSFKKLIAIRLLDDWAYQANLRQELRNDPNFNLKKGFKEYVKQTENFLDISLNDISFNLPWNRKFEVEICLEHNKE